MPHRLTDDDDDFDDYDEDDFDDYDGTSEPPTPAEKPDNPHYGKDAGTQSWLAVERKHELWKDMTLKHGTGNSVTACRVVFGGQAVITATHSGEMTLWALPSGVELCTVHAHLGCVADCHVWESNGKKPRHRILSASHDGTIAVWDANISEKELAKAKEQERGKGGAAIAPKFTSGDRSAPEPEPQVEAKPEASEEEKAAAATAAASKVLQRAGGGAGLAEWADKKAPPVAVAPQRAVQAPRQLAKLGDEPIEPHAAPKAAADDAAKHLQFLSSYIVTIERHPENGLGITVDTDADNNAFVDELVNFPDGSPGAAEQAGVKKGSQIVKIGGIKVLGLGVQAVGAAVQQTLGAGRPLEFELMDTSAPKVPVAPAKAPASMEGPEPADEPAPTQEESEPAAAGDSADGQLPQDTAVDQPPKAEATESPSVEAQTQGEEGDQGDQGAQDEEDLGGTSNQEDDEQHNDAGPEWECPSCEERNPFALQKCDCCGDPKPKERGEGGGSGEDASEDGTGGDGEDAGDLFGDLLVVGKNVDPNAIDNQFQEDAQFFEPRVLRGRGLKLLSRISEGNGADDLDSEADPDQKDRDSVIACRWSPGGKHIVSVFHDGSLQRWSLKKGIKDCGKQRALANEEEDPTCMCWASDSDDVARVLIGTSEGRLILVAVETMADLTTMEGHTGPISSCFWRHLSDDEASSGGGTDEAVSCSWDGTTRIWSVLIDNWTKAVTEVTQVASLSAPDQSPHVMRALSVSPCAQEMAVAIENEVAIFDLASQAFRLSARWHRDTITAVDYALRGGSGAEEALSIAGGAPSVVCSGSRDGTARVWCQCSPADACGRRLSTSDHVTLHCCASGSGYVALAGADSSVSVWLGDLLHFRADGDAGDAWCCCFSPDGAHLAVGFDDSKVLVYDMKKSDDPVSLEDFDMESVLCCSFAGDGSLLATGGWDGALRLWDTDDWVCKAALTGHDGQVRGCDFRRSRGRPTLVASGGTDNTVRVWHCGDEKCVKELRGHTGPVNEVAFTAPSEFYTRLVSASDDMSLRLWDVDSGKALMSAPSLSISVSLDTLSRGVL